MFKEKHPHLIEVDNIFQFEALVHEAPKGVEHMLLQISH
jgi:hypothetical protein